MATTGIEQLTLAVCLFDNVTALDFQGPMESIGSLAPSMIFNPPEIIGSIGSKVAVDAVYLGPTADPVRPVTGPLMTPTRTYDEVKEDEQFDILLIPGGPGTVPGAVPPSLLEFLKKQAPGAKYVLSVCTGSWVLAQAGLLRGKRATSNKFLFNIVKSTTQEENVQWVAKARWVVDGKYWTSSGVTAGIDMAHAFLTHLAGEAVATKVRNLVEASVRGEGDDEFAAVFGL